MPILIAHHGQFDPNLLPGLKNTFPEVTIKAYEEIADPAERDLISVLVARGGLCMDKSFLEQTPALRLIIKAGSGTDDVDIEAARNRGITVHATGGSAVSVAELSLALSLTCLRHLTIHNDAMKDGTRRSRDQFIGRTLHGRTVSLIGFGRIGQHAGRLFSAFGARLLVHDRSPENSEKQIAAAECGAKFLPLKDAVAGADIISLHAPWVRGDAPILNSEIMKFIHPATILVNTARANLIDRDALLEALDDGRISFAGLDVLYDETEYGDMDITSRSNVISLPHVGAQTAEAQKEIADRIAMTIREFSQQTESA